MTLQRRLLLYLLICALAVWGLALAISFHGARDEVDELFDTELIRLARHVHALLPSDGDASRLSFGALPRAPREGAIEGGAADVRDLAIAAWDRAGNRVLDLDGASLPYKPGRSGFVDQKLDGESWRIYYLASDAGDWLTAAGQRSYERDELVYDLTLGQLAPWIVMLPLLLVAMAGAVKLALSPMQVLAQHLGQRSAGDLTPIPVQGQPGELVPLLHAMNGLFTRVAEILAHERRFTADAAHELRTPLAALRVQWDVVRRAAPGDARVSAEEKLAAGLERMDRLVAQLLMLSRVESLRPDADSMVGREEIHWRGIVEDVVAECLPLAERRHVEIDCEWPADDRRALPVLGSGPLLAVMLRNLLDNAIRYATSPSTVVMTFSEAELTIDNDCEPIRDDQLARIGEPFYRIEGQAEPGSGLGISIALRIASSHGLDIQFGPREGGAGFRARVHFAQGQARSPERF